MVFDEREDGVGRFEGLNCFGPNDKILLLMKFVVKLLGVTG